MTKSTYSHLGSLLTEEIMQKPIGAEKVKVENYGQFYKGDYVEFDMPEAPEIEGVIRQHKGETVLIETEYCTVTVPTSSVRFVYSLPLAPLDSHTEHSSDQLDWLE